MSSYVELASWMARRFNGQHTLRGKWRKFIHSAPPVGPWCRTIHFDSFHAGVISTIDILSKLEWQDPPILDLQLGELRDELQQLAEEETQGSKPETTKASRLRHRMKGGSLNGQRAPVNHRTKLAVREIQLFDRRGKYVNTVGLPPIGPEAEIVRYGDLLYVRISHLRYREARVYIARDFR